MQARGKVKQIPPKNPPKNKKQRWWLSLMKSLDSFKKNVSLMEGLIQCTSNLTWITSSWRLRLPPPPRHISLVMANNVRLEGSVRCEWQSGRGGNCEQSCSTTLPPDWMLLIGFSVGFFTLWWLHPCKQPAWEAFEQQSLPRSLASTVCDYLKDEADTDGD